jgi:2-isopropylmalate synthase
MTDRVYIYDSTLRDGAQTQGIDFSVLDKQFIAQQLDKLGIDYIEGGWPGANPTDDEFFAKLPEVKHSVYTAFGMTRRPTTSAANDPGLNTLLNVGTKSVCIVGKSWDYHVTHALEITLEENVKMISESIAHIVKQKREAVFDSEHFFDGYKANPAYALKVVEAAYKAGAHWIVLCDTNGGTMPHEIEEIVGKVVKHIPGKHLGIHCHNDTEQAVANSLAAVRAGVRQVQGTVNGVGERCGNANLTSIIPTLMLKMGFKTNAKLDQLTHISRAIQERLNRAPNPYAAYVGASAFAHKGGLHVSAVAKHPDSYEHIKPELVGNVRNILVSDQAGRANIVARLKQIGIPFDAKSAGITRLVEEVKQREASGYAYDGADASFELLARRMLGDVPNFYDLQSFRVIDERRYNAKGKLVTLSEATLKVKVAGKSMMTVAEGNGPVNALDKALRKALSTKYKSLKEMRLVDYKVRIIPSHGTDALTRVWIESADANGEHWCTIGVSPNVIDASYNALQESITWKLLRGLGWF